MAQRIIFVGIHNKPGKTPLDSTTRSGKLIDKVIAKLSDYEFRKSNIYDSDYLPDNTDDYTAVQEWAKRVSYSGNDIVVLLGAITHRTFRGHLIRVIKIGHPSGVWSHKDKKTYIKNAIKKILKK